MLHIEGRLDERIQEGYVTKEQALHEWRWN